MKWATQWRDFVHSRTNIIPAEIDNSHIHSENNMLAQELIKDTDYFMIPSTLWTFVIEIKMCAKQLNELWDFYMITYLQIKKKLLHYKIT